MSPVQLVLLHNPMSVDVPGSTEQVLLVTVGAVPCARAQNGHHNAPLAWQKLSAFAVH